VLQVALERPGKGGAPFKVRIEKKAKKAPKKKQATSSGGTFQAFQSFSDQGGVSDGNAVERFRDAIKVCSRSSAVPVVATTVVATIESAHGSISQSGDMNLVHELLDSVDLNNQDKLGNSSLHQVITPLGHTPTWYISLQNRQPIGMVSRRHFCR
jgi:hypothetical protein